VRRTALQGSASFASSAESGTVKIVLSDATEQEVVAALALEHVGARAAAFDDVSR
jgi:hypothetical protein